jgi:hypothetical protein
MAFTISIKPPAPLLTAPASSAYTNRPDPAVHLERGQLCGFLRISTG